MKTRFLFPCLALLVFAPALFIASNSELRQAGELFITHGTYHPFWSLTLPRFLLAIMAGMMLAVSGLLLQTTLKNHTLSQTQVIRTWKNPKKTEMIVQVQTPIPTEWTQVAPRPDSVKDSSL